MSFMKGLQDAYRGFVDITSIPEQQRTQRQIQHAQEWVKLNEDIQERATARAAKADQAGLRQAAELAPAAFELDKRRRDDEARRTAAQQQQQFSHTVGVLGEVLQGRNALQEGQFSGQRGLIDAQYDGAGSLVRTQGDIDLRKLQAAQQALGTTQGHERDITGMFVGQEALVPQAIAATRGMQTERLAHEFRLAEMYRPNLAVQALIAAAPLAIALTK